MPCAVPPRKREATAHGVCLLLSKRRAGCGTSRRSRLRLIPIQGTTMTATSSPWSVESSARTAAPLAGDVRYDVCVIGGGIAGLTTAYLLACEGKSVVVLDGKPKVAAGETEYTTAHLAWVIDDRFTRVASIRCDEAARLAAA